MPEVPRRTPARPAEVAGRGLFSGLPATVRILPADAGDGIRLRRADSLDSYPARIDHVFVPQNLPGRNTCLAAADGGSPVLTVEHILSALAGLGVTDAVLEVDGSEIPIMDGSALAFVEAVRGAGIRELGGSADPLVVSREIEVRAGESVITARPRAAGAAGGAYRYELDYGQGSPIPAQSAAVELGDAGVYEREVAPARTFCLEAEALQMRSIGLFEHLSTRDMLVIGAGGPIDNVLRFANEPARHKLLDLIGDLALVGRPIVGEIIARRAGHALNHEMARSLLKAFG